EADAEGEMEDFATGVIPCLMLSAPVWSVAQASCAVPAKTQTCACCDVTVNPVSAVAGVFDSLEHPYVAPFGSAMHCRSTACCWILLSDNPGICTSIVLPDNAMSGSPTPNASTRLRMFSRACCIVSAGVPSGADKITETPPLRSRPSVGWRRPVANAATDNATTTTTMIIETHRPLPE